MITQDLPGYVSGVTSNDLLESDTPLEISLLDAARQRGLPLSSETRLFTRLCPAPVVGITASKNPITIDDGGVMRTFRFINADRRLVSAVAQEVRAALDAYDTPAARRASDHLPLVADLRLPTD